MDLPAPAAACPVCGDALGAAPRRCGRCDTPHHAECWDYVPGCAIFGCVESAPPALLSWPWTHQVLLARARLTTLNAHLIQGAILSFAALIAIPKDSSPALFGAFVALSFFGALGLALQVGLEVFYRLSPARHTVAEAARLGDRRLRDEIDRRAGALIPWASWKVAWVLGMACCTPFLVRDIIQAVATGEVQPVLIGLFVALPTVGAGIGAFFFPGLWLSEKMIGSQRVLIRRLEASLPAAPEKPGG